MILITQYFNPPCQLFPLCLAGGIKFPKRPELTAMGKPHTDRSADKSKKLLLHPAPPTSRNAHKLWPTSANWVKNQILCTQLLIKDFLCSFRWWTGKTHPFHLNREDLFAAFFPPCCCTTGFQHDQAHLHAPCYKAMSHSWDLARNKSLGSEQRHLGWR